MQKEYGNLYVPPKRPEFRIRSRSLWEIRLFGAFLTTSSFIPLLIRTSVFVRSNHVGPYLKEGVERFRAFERVSRSMPNMEFPWLPRYPWSRRDVWL
jgi:hypothetical protein